MRGIRLVGLSLAGILVFAACGKSGGLSASSIKSNGKMVWCSDITYPPEEFYKGNTPVGSDIDIAREVTKRVAGVSAEFDNTGFTGIIPALLAKKCDAIISAMNDNAERRRQVDFVDYLDVGQTLSMKPGNPAGIHSLADLSGHSVSVEEGTTNLGFLKDESKKLVAAGKKPIDIIGYPKDTDAANALKTGKVDAYFADSPVAVYYHIQDPSTFGVLVQPINPIPVGMAFRPADSALAAAVKSAIDAMYSDGTMCRILKKWSLTAFVLKGQSC